MDREIKFRAWVTFESGNKGMLDNDNLQEWTLEDLTADDGDILMQYTGLKDKNGKEIYEGDIINGGIHSNLVVTWHCDSGDWAGRKNHIHPDICGWVLSSSIEGACTGIDTIFKKLEIIGNIYENPKLLKQ